MDSRLPGNDKGGPGTSEEAVGSGRSALTRPEYGEDVAPDSGLFLPPLFQSRGAKRNAAAKEAAA